MDSNGWGIGKVSTAISLITATLAVVTKIFGLLPDIYFLPEILIGIAAISLMTFAGKLIWSKRQTAGFASQVRWKYKSKIRALGAIALFLTPCLAASIWYFGLRLPSDQ